MPQGIAQDVGDVAKLWINLGMPYGGAAAGRVVGLAAQAGRAAVGVGQKLVGKGPNLLAPVAPQVPLMNRGLQALDLEGRAFPQGNKIQGPKADFKMDLRPQGDVMPKHQPPVLKKDLAPQKPQGGHLKALPGDFYANNLNQALKLEAKLAFQEARVLSPKGKLTKTGIGRSKEIILEDQIRNPKVIAELTKDGSSMVDWKKFKTPSVTLSNGERVQIHYYRNIKTGRVDYVTKDFKLTKKLELWKK